MKTLLISTCTHALSNKEFVLPISNILNENKHEILHFENCNKAKKAGANVLVSGSTIFKENQGNLEKNIGILRTN